MQDINKFLQRLPLLVMLEMSRAEQEELKIPKLEEAKEAFFHTKAIESEHGLNLVAHQQRVAILDSDGIWKEDMELLRNQFPPHL